MMDKMRMETADITAQNIEKIGTLFPNCITEMLDIEKSTAENKVYKKAINFELLKQMLSKEAIDSNEAYEFTWVGKKASIIEANKPIRKTLRPCKDESTNWDDTQNLYIEGDNLEVLKLLQESYLGKVKMIYIDPPYNTGNDFISNDDFKINRNEYANKSGETDEEGNRMLKNTDSNGCFHSDWCSMIYPRLLLARNLLSDDGVIFISIDDNEQANLKKICDEVFGGENFVACLPTIMNLKGNNDEFGFAGTHEYTIVYAKNKNLLKLGEFNIDDEELDDWRIDEKGYFKQGANLKSTGINAPREKRPNLFFPIFIDADNKIYISDNNNPPFENLEVIYPITNNQEMSWRWSKEKFKKDIDDVIVSRSGTIGLYKKQRPSLGDIPSKKPKTLFYKPSYSSGNGTAEAKNLFDKKIFSNPKPLQLLIDFIQISTNKDDLILDFFAGSGTTAHAVMQLNAQDGGNRKFIMVQLPELCDETSEAYKAGYKNICEIGKERISRAGKKILEDNKDKEGIENLDTGFRVLKLDDTNMRDVYYSPSEYSQDLLSTLESNVKSDRSDLDLLFGCLLEWGLPLSLPYSCEKIGECTVHNYNDGDLIACFDEDIPESVIKEIAKKRPIRAVFRDSSFANSPSRINVAEIFKLLAPDTRVKVI